MENCYSTSGKPTKSPRISIKPSAFKSKDQVNPVVEFMNQQKDLEEIIPKHVRPSTILEAKNNYMRKILSPRELRPIRV